MSDPIDRRGVIDFINDIEHTALKRSNDNSDDVLYKAVLITTKAIRGYCRIAPTAQTERQEIGYDDCANAMLKMWMDSVITDGEYKRIMDKLNKYWMMEGQDD